MCQEVIFECVEADGCFGVALSALLISSVAPVKLGVHEDTSAGLTVFSPGGLGASCTLCHGLRVVLVCPAALPEHWLLGSVFGALKSSSLAGTVWGGSCLSGQLESSHDLRTRAAALSSAILLFLS